MKKESSSSEGLSASHRSFSPTSSPINYSAVGLNLVAMKAKTAAHQEAQNKRDNYQNYSDGSRAHSFHRRRNSLADNRSHSQPDLLKQTSTNRQGTGTAKPRFFLKPQLTIADSAVGNNTGGVSEAGLRPPATPARGRHFTSSSVLSPGMYGPNSQPPVTPHSQLGSVLQMSPVSSPGSMEPSPVTPVTPFNPRTPKTPRSVQAGPRSVNVERDFVAPSPALPGPTQSFTQPQSVKSIENIPVTVNMVEEEVKVDKGLKRPTLGIVEN